MRNIHMNKHPAMIHPFVLKFLDPDFNSAQSSFYNLREVYENESAHFIFDSVNNEKEKFSKYSCDIGESDFYEVSIDLFRCRVFH